jgi:RNA polymerase sigma-70 factor (ECF subfamily)
VNDAVLATPDVLVDHLFRNRAGQMVAYLTRLLGPEHIDLAEEVVQEALLKALQNWPYSGIPQNPAGWLFRVARNAALDAIRHRTLAGEKNVEFAAERIRDVEAAVGDGTHIEDQLRDDELRMVLMCCHPALPRDARVALSLKTVGGFSTREIARAFLSDEPTIAQRLVRAKRQIRESAIAFELPLGDDLALRLDSALEVIYLMFNEGYAAQSGEGLVRQDLCGEALRLGRLLAKSSVGTPQAHALVALIAFQAARLPARVDSGGELVLLEDQDRTLWDQKLVALGFHHFSQCAEGAHMSAYHVQAAIAAVYAGAQQSTHIDWPAILSLYDRLMEISPSPVVALNRAVAIAKVEGPQAALAALRPLAEDRSLRNYHLLPAVQGRLLLNLGDHEAAADCFRQALERPCSEPEKRFLQRKLRTCM